MCGGESRYLTSYDTYVLESYWRDVAKVDSRVHLYRCSQYGSFIVEGLPSSDALIAQYNQHGDEDFRAVYYTGNKDASAKAIRLVDSIRGLLADGDRVLDVGGGNGAFAREVARAGYESWMTEGSTGGFELLREAGVHPITEIGPELEGTFDVLTLWDVYEHVWPHKEFFEPLYRALKPGGKLIFETPIPSKLRQIFLVLSYVAPSPYRERLLDEIVSFTHVQLCSPDEIRATLPAHGFEVESIEDASELSYKGAEYVGRHVKPRFLANWIGALFDTPIFRRVVLGNNKAFVVARRVEGAAERSEPGNR